MLGLHPVVIAAFVAATAVGLSAAYLLTHARRKARERAGIEALAQVKWRDFAHLVLEAMRRDGYVEEDLERQPGDSGFDFVLAREGERVLLSCKHGRTFRLGEAVVRDFATAVRMHGVSGGIIATLGTIEGFAREVAEANQIDVIDGAQLWQRVAPLMPEPVTEHIQHHTQAEAKRRLGIATAASLTLGAVVFLALAGVQDRRPTATEIATRSALPVPAATAPRPAPLSQVNGRTDPLELDDQALNHRRLTAARSLASMPALIHADWSTRSTLVLSLAEHDTRNEVIDPLVDEACRMLVQYEELRYTRLQLEPAPGRDSPVRWRQCR
ncbi:restriction endonuclease [Alkalisalibacterium limincola]|uniref:Restriction endonuclease n=1 Tax=Alkalisalibacterium limincola TaxID=2699169 RepID=A0A5C8KVL9_9GAMM|nr:restriction endonuclease [Alkalisalibacterium limincola]TXK64552.1 restriction endonuclease [Alkalisalibacterium limincola]